MKPDERAKLVLNYMLKTGSSIVATAKHFDVSEATIHSDIKNRIFKFASIDEIKALRNIIKNNTTKGLTADEKERLNKEYTSGRSINSLSNETKHSKATISKYINNQNKNVNSHHMKLQNQISQMLDYFINSDKTFDQICDEINMDSDEVITIFNEVGRLLIPRKFDIVNKKYHIYNDEEVISKIK